MKKYLLVLMFLALSASLFAAGPYTPFKTGLAAGVSFNPLLFDSDLSFSTSSIGAQIHVNSLISLKPSLIFYKYTRYYEDQYLGYPERKGDDDLFFGAQLDVPLHLFSFESGSLYLGPSFLFGKYNEDNYSGTTSEYLSSTYETTLFAAGAVIGGQYLIAKHFAFYAESGFTYLSRSRDSQSFDASGNTTGESKNRYTTMSFKPATIGFIAYFN